MLETIRSDAATPLAQVDVYAVNREGVDRVGIGRNYCHIVARKAHCHEQQGTRIDHADSVCFLGLYSHVVSAAACTHTFQLYAQILPLYTATCWDKYWCICMTAQVGRSQSGLGHMLHCKNHLA